MARPRRSIPRAPRDIIEFVTGDEYLGDRTLSVPQLAVLKAIYGLEMTVEEAAAFSAMHEQRPAKKGGYEEVSLGFGRRSGKGEKIGANVVAYECIRFNPEHLAPGETAYGIVVAQNEKQARIVRDYVEAKLRILEEKGWRVFEEVAAQSRSVTAEVIRLANRVHVACFPCKKVAVRGVTAIVILLDELGHWQLEADAYNADVEVIRAIRPCRATMRARGLRVPLLKTSTPFDEIGAFHDDWKRRDRSRQMVLHEVPTRFLNPTITQEFLEEERIADPESFDREYLAKWGSGAQSKPITGDMVDACTEHGRLIVPPRPGTEYVARLDAAYKRDTFPVGIGHLEGETVVVDLLQVWKPRSGGRHLDDKEVVAEMAGLLRPYGIDRVAGDQFCDVPLKTELQKYGIGFMEKPTTETSKFIEFQNLIAVMSAKQLRLPDDQQIKIDLTGIRKKGKWVGAPKLANRHDDIFTVIRGIVFDLLPMSQRLDLAEMNRGAMPQTEMERLFRPAHRDSEELPVNFMAEVF